MKPIYTLFLCSRFSIVHSVYLLPIPIIYILHHAAQWARMNQNAPSLVQAKFSSYKHTLPCFAAACGQLRCIQLFLLSPSPYRHNNREFSIACADRHVTPSLHLCTCNVAGGQLHVHKWSDASHAIVTHNRKLPNELLTICTQSDNFA